MFPLTSALRIIDGWPPRSANFCCSFWNVALASPSDPLTASWTANPPVDAVSTGAGVVGATAIGWAEATLCGAGWLAGPAGVDEGCGDAPPATAAGLGLPFGVVAAAGVAGAGRGAGVD